MSLAGPQQISTLERNYYSMPRPRMVADNQGGLHLVSAGGQVGTLSEPGGLYYQYKPQNDAWSTAKKFLSEVNSFDLTIDSSNTLHLLYVEKTNNVHGAVYHMTKPANGEWTYPSPTGISCSNIRVVAGPQNELHALCDKYIGEDGYVYCLHRLPGGSWRSPVKVSELYTYRFGAIDLILDKDGTAHFLYTEEDQLLRHRARQLNGVISKPEIISLPPEGTCNFSLLWVHASQALDERKIACWGEDHNTVKKAFCAWQEPGGSWSDPAALPELTRVHDMEMDQQGGLHLFGNNENKSRSSYLYRRPDGTWQAPLAMDDRYGGGEGDLLVDAHNRLYMVWTTMYLMYQSFPLADSSGEVSVAQTITIPADMHRPTLSLTYKLPRATGIESSGAEVLLISGSGTTQLLELPGTSRRKNAWADLSPWAGQTVTLEVHWNEQTGKPRTSLYLDDFSVGPWLTPVINSITPEVFTSGWKGAQITIKGENFIGTPTVKIGALTLTGVVRQDEFTIQAVIPPGLVPGTNDIWVINPGGQPSVLSGGLHLGDYVYLPFMRR